MKLMRQELVWMPDFDFPAAKPTQALEDLAVELYAAEQELRAHRRLREIAYQR